MSDEAAGWLPIETFPGDTPYWTSPASPGVRYYENVRVKGPTWAGQYGDDDYPNESDLWFGPEKEAVGSTNSGVNFFETSGTAPSGYPEYLRATHWMPLKSGRP
ncbi:hypothetical protein [Muricoccus radiodurans]|uniref:hypothetical protein n=1 Tax=Muricoccus radiodurans TaxID=2231721 RepID=UPI003CEA53C1